MSDCNCNMEFGSFSEAIRSMNNALAGANAVVKYVWENNCKKCKLRKFDQSFEVIMCRFPEQINCTDKDNCIFESCPLIHR